MEVDENTAKHKTKQWGRHIISVPLVAKKRLKRTPINTCIHKIGELLS
jgi:hypothetical protein